MTSRLLRLFSVVLALLFAPAAFAQQSATAAGQAVKASGSTAQTISLWQHIERGGYLVYVLLAISVVCVLIILVCAFTIRRSAVLKAPTLDKMETLLSRGDFNTLAKYCRERSEHVARIIGPTVDFHLENPRATIEHVREVAQAHGGRIAGLLTQRVSLLADIAAIAPMVGLAGTVVGMIKSFSSISDGSFATARQMQLATGVSEALVNTAGGLFVCIPAMIAYAIFRGKVQHMISDMEAYTTHLLGIYAAEVQSGRMLRPGIDRHSESQPDYTGGRTRREASPDLP